MILSAEYWFEWTKLKEGRVAQIALMLLISTLSFLFKLTGLPNPSRDADMLSLWVKTFTSKFHLSTRTLEFWPLSSTSRMRACLELAPCILPKGLLNSSTHCKYSSKLFSRSTIIPKFLELGYFWIDWGSVIYLDWTINSREELKKCLQLEVQW